MKFGAFVEKHFWIILLAGIVAGLWGPISVPDPRLTTKLILGLMMFFLFLKIDALDVLENIKNLRLMAYIALFYMVIIPLVFFFAFRIIDKELAVGMLLLTAMPAGISSPALSDILKGNTSLSMSLVIVTQLIAPFTVPLLFWLIELNSVSINKLVLLRDISILVFVPMILSQIAKRLFPSAISNTRHLFTSLNIFLLFALVYVAISMQRRLILDRPGALIWEIILLYLVFILLHLAGYLICPKEKKENKVSLAIGSAYMNNGMAIVLAASYFRPEVLVLMALSELPWNTLPALFKRLIAKLNDN